MDLEDQMCRIIRQEYASDGYVDEGRSDSAAHQIWVQLLKPLLARIRESDAPCRLIDDVIEEVEG